MPRQGEATNDLGNVRTYIERSACVFLNMENKVPILCRDDVDAFFLE